MTDNNLFATIKAFDKMDSTALEAEYEYWAHKTYWAMRSGLRPVEIEMYRAIAIAALHAIR